MKKVVVLLLTIILAFSCCGCGPSKSKIVTNMISSLPSTITLDSEATIVAAEEAYAELSDKQKLEVEGYGRLLDARASLDSMLIEESLKGEWVCKTDGSLDADYNCWHCKTNGTQFKNDLQWIVLKENHVAAVYWTHDDIHYSDHYYSGGFSGTWEYVNGNLTVAITGSLSHEYIDVYTVANGQLIHQDTDGSVFVKN